MIVSVCADKGSPGVTDLAAYSHRALHGRAGSLCAANDGGCAGCAWCAVDDGHRADGPVVAAASGAVKRRVRQVLGRLGRP